jgi:hypothetical protein
MARIAEFRSAVGRRGGASLAILAVGVIAGLLVVVSAFMTVVSVDVASGACNQVTKIADRCELTGFERHSVAPILIGAFTILMAWGAGVGGSRPAAVALVLLGALTLATALLSDLPEAGRNGVVRDFFSYELADASPGTGLSVEVVGGALSLVAGLARLWRGPEP